MPSIARLLSAFVILAGLAGAVKAADVAPADQSAIRGLITGQIDAFGKDDGATAFGFASPMIKGLFHSPENFMAMVKQSYQPVYRPKSVTFGPIVDTPSGPLQKVFLTGPDGKGYVAGYTMERQPDGSWLINGCVILEENGPTI